MIVLQQYIYTVAILTDRILNHGEICLHVSFSYIQIQCLNIDKISLSILMLTISLLHIREARTPLIGNIHGTKYRIQTTLRIYKQLFDRYPTTIIMNTILWDLQGMSNHTVKFSDIKQNLLSMISLVKSIVGTESAIGLRTAPAGVSGFNSINIMNKIIREIFEEKNCSILYDYDKDVWSTLNFEINADNHALLFVDSHHPNGAFTTNGAEKMLNTSYSSYYEQHNVNVNYLDLISNSNYKIKFLRSLSPANISTNYFSHCINNTRYKYLLNVSEKDLGHWMYASKGDYFLLPIEKLQLIPTLPMQPILDGKLRGIVTKTKEMYLILIEPESKVHEVSNFSIFSIFHVEKSNILFDVPDFWIKELRKGERSFL